MTQLDDYARSAIKDLVNRKLSLIEVDGNKAKKILQEDARKQFPKEMEYMYSHHGLRKLLDDTPVNINEYLTLRVVAVPGYRPSNEVVKLVEEEHNAYQNLMINRGHFCNKFHSLIDKANTFDDLRRTLPLFKDSIDEEECNCSSRAKARRDAFEAHVEKLNNENFDMLLKKLTNAGVKG